MMMQAGVGCWQSDSSGLMPNSPVRRSSFSGFCRLLVIFVCSNPAQGSIIRVKIKRAFMKRDGAISRLQQLEADLKRLGVEHLYMFDSTARGETKDDSDVDLFFDTKRERSACSKFSVSSLAFRNNIGNRIF
jgi:hypothetical protein